MAIGSVIASAVLVGVAAAGIDAAIGASVGACIAIGFAAAGMQVLRKMPVASLLSGSGLGGVGNSSTSTGRTSDPDSMLPLMYGKCVYDPDTSDLAIGCSTGTVFIYENVHDDNYLFQAHVWGNGEVEHFIDSIMYGSTELLGDGVHITSEGVVNGGMLAGDLAKYVQLEIYFGSDNYQPNSKSLASQYAGSDWDNSTFLGNGCAQLYIVIKKDDDMAENGLDDLLSDNNSITIRSSGIMIADVRTDEIAATNNPANQVYDMLTNEIYGASIPPSLIDLASFQAAADYCDTYEYLSTGTVSASSDFTDTLNLLLSTAQLVLYTKGGKLYIIPDIPGDSVLSFDPSMIYGSVNLTTTGISDYWNTVDITYTDVTNDWATDVLRIPSDLSTIDLEKSGGRVIVQDIDLTFVQDKDQISEIGNRLVLKEQYTANSFSFTTSWGWEVNVFDVIDITFPEYGFQNKLFRVTSKTISTDPTSFGYIKFVVCEYWPEVYDGEDAGNWSPDSNIPSPVNVLPAANLECTKVGETTNGYECYLSWDASTDPYLMGYYIYYRGTGETGWINSGSTTKYITDYELYNLDASKQYDFAVAAYNNIGYISAKCELDNQSPDYNYTLPSVTGINLVNHDETPETTDSNYFSISWDDQSDLPVGDSGKLFKDYFSYYEIRVYNKAGEFKTSYNSTTNAFTYTYDEGTHDQVGRDAVFGIIPHGMNSGTVGEEVTAEFSNEQCPKLLNLTAKSGNGYIIFDYDNSNFPSDWQGVLIEISSTDTFTNIQSNTTDSTFEYFFPCADNGDYFCRAASYDVFGQDVLNFSDTVQVHQQTQWEYDDLASDVTDQIINSAQMNEIVESIVQNETGQYWTITADTNGYISGIGMGNTGTEADFTIVADEFFLVSAASVQSGTDDPVTPFVVQDDEVYINSACIQDLSVTNAMIANASIDELKVQDAAITSAKIAQTISSDNWDETGDTGWMIDRDGTANFQQANITGTVYATDGKFTGELNATSGVFDSVTGNNSTFNNCIISQDCTILGTLSANSIEGDIFMQQMGIASFDIIGQVNYTSGTAYNDLFHNYVQEGHKFEYWKIAGADFDRYLTGAGISCNLYHDGDRGFTATVIVGGDGLTDVTHWSQYCDDFTKTYADDGAYFLPAVGEGNFNYVWLTIDQSDSSNSIRCTQGGVQVTVFKAGHTAVTR